MAPARMVQDLIRASEGGYCAHDVRVLDGALRFHLVVGSPMMGGAHIWQEFELHALPSL